MKLVEARVYLVEIRGRHPDPCDAIAKTQILVQVFTDEGISGVGEAAIAYGTGAGGGHLEQTNCSSGLLSRK